MNSEEDHFRVDTETLIYKPLYELMDLTPLVNNFEYTVSNGHSVVDVKLSQEFFDEYLKNLMLKNGFAMNNLEFGVMNQQMRMMKSMSQDLIVLIEKEI